jgi:hypothetical protein
MSDLAGKTQGFRVFAHPDTQLPQTQPRILQIFMEISWNTGAGMLAGSSGRLTRFNFVAFPGNVIGDDGAGFKRQRKQRIRQLGIDDPVFEDCLCFLVQLGRIGIGQEGFM